jgi:hypothetical protein
MSDDKINVGGQDRSRVASDQDYEVRHFAEANNISIEQAEQLITQHGNSRDKLEEAVRQMNG